jgi:hypothetical protein
MATTIRGHGVKLGEKWSQEFYNSMGKPQRIRGEGTTRIREEKPGNWKFARVKCPREQWDS